MASLLRILALLVLLRGASPIPLAAQESGPFAPRIHEIEGQIHQVWALSIAGCEHAAADLLVLSTRGVAPDAEKRLTWMPCGSALVPDDPRIIERRLPPETAVVDVARVPGRSGPQLFLVSGEGVRIEALGGDDPPRVLPIPGGLPMPTRPWDLSRLRLVDDWHDRGPPSLLLPALRGAWLVDLETGQARTLEMPVYGEYRTWMPHLPETTWSWMVQDVRWPTLSRADDNGDGRLDLFALSRWGIWIYHTGPEGLPAEPSRRLRLAPFDEETERRHQATATNYFARDIDGDTRADVLLSTIGGGLSDGRSESRVFLNPGTGIAVDGDPDAERILEGGFSGFTFVDVDGDGRDEILEASLEFGVVQIVRFLLTRRAEMTIRVLGLDASTRSGTRTLFEDDFSFRIDFSEGSISGLVPSLGDWNGDGVQDFYLNRSDDEISFRMGSRKTGEPMFGPEIGRQPVPLAAGQSRVADLDGDGLDEIVAFDSDRPDTPLVVFENLGRLPGTRPSMTGPDEASRDAGSGAPQAAPTSPR